MRDIVILGLILGSLPFILRQPFIGVLVWSWISYMNPHRLGWGMVNDLPVAYIVAVTLLVSLAINRPKMRVPLSGLTILWGIFILWMCITTIFAIYYDDALAYLTRVIKIQLMTIISIALLDSKKRVDALLWVIVLSIGFYGFKGGIFTLITGGTYRVYGPFNSFIEENNSLALALLMILPLMVYLRSQANGGWVKRGLLFSMPVIVFSILGSQSRGALIGITATALFLVFKSKHRVIGFIGIGILGIGALIFMPDSWHQRMQTIENYEQDASAMGRINAWYYSFNVANDRLTGAGFESWSYPTFSIYAPNPEDVHAAHSIYFGVLADHGWIGLLLWLGILITAWRTNSWVIRHAKSAEGLEWAEDLAKMLQVSMVAYGSAGAFLSLSYFDLPWHIIGIVVVLKDLVRRRLSLQRNEWGMSEPEKSSPAL